MKKRVLAMIMILVMLIAMLTGCGSGNKNEDKDTKDTVSEVTEEGSKTYNGVDISKELTLKMYLLGDRSKDFDKVYAEINQILKEKLNTTVEIEFLSWSEHDTKYSLLFSSGEEFDLIFTASGWGHYEATAAMGGFYELSEDFIKTYAPDIWKVVPSAAWTQALIDSKVFMVPNYQNEFAVNVLAVRGDFMKKYGYDTISSWDDLLAYYGDITTGEAGITPLGTQGGGLLYPFLLHKGVDIIGGSPSELFIYNTLAPEDLSITYALDWEGFAEYCKAVKQMFDAGYWSADSLATTEERQDGLLNGTAASMVWNLGSCKLYAEQANKEHPDWEVTIADIASDIPKGVNPYINNGVAINAVSNNKERAMMVLNEFYTNPAIYDLASLGIEGTHWEAVSDDQYKLLDANADYGVDNNCNWGWTNADIRREQYVENPTALDKKAQELQDKWSENIKADHIYDGFTFDNSKVSSEIAAVGTVITQYYTPLMCGMAGDVDKAISELRTQLENAGIQNIYDEIQKQAAAFVESKR